MGATQSPRQVTVENLVRTESDNYFREFDSPLRFIVLPSNS